MWEKADTSQTPHAGIVDYCKSNPAAELVPAAAAGRATVYEWRCKAEDRHAKQVATPDAQGFIDGIWGTDSCARCADLRHNLDPDRQLGRLLGHPAPRAMLTPMEFSESVLRSSLTGWEHQVLDKLLQAAAYMDAAYWQQVDPEGEQIFRSLTGDDPQTQARTRDDGRQLRPLGSLRQLCAVRGRPAAAAGWLCLPARPDQGRAGRLPRRPPRREGSLLSSYTVVRRDGDKLVAVPYHEVYADYVEPTAALLEEAAALSQNASLTDYLQKQAQALRTDDYFDADMAWLDLDANLDISIGPHETYDDQLTGQKTFYKANVLVVDRAAGARLDAFKAAVPAEQANLPVPAAYRPDQAGTMTPLELADDVLRSGQGRAVMEPVAFSLPNDPRVWAAKGAKKVIMSNFWTPPAPSCSSPAGGDPGRDAQLGDGPDGYFNWLLGTRSPTPWGRARSCRTARKSPSTRRWESTTSPSRRARPTSPASTTPSICANRASTRRRWRRTTPASWPRRCAPSALAGSAYGVIRSAAWNFFVERGALKLDARRAFVVDVDR